MKPPLRILSFGGGVQSSYLARLALEGDIEPFDHVIFADTGDEPAAVYDNLKWWEHRFTDSGVPFHIVANKRGSISSTVLDAAENRGKHTPTPVFILNADGTKGITPRECTRDFKLDPIFRFIRELIGVAGKRHNHITDHLVSNVMGISYDESQRMTDAKYKWMRNEYPLVDRRIRRYEIIAAMAATDEYPDPPRSACWHCPFHSDEEWRHLRNNAPADFAKAVELDEALRRPGALGLTGFRGAAFLHRSATPLADVDFDNEEDRGQMTLWDNECEGMCGL